MFGKFTSVWFFKPVLILSNENFFMYCTHTVILYPEKKPEYLQAWRKEGDFEKPFNNFNYFFSENVIF